MQTQTNYNRFLCPSDIYTLYRRIGNSVKTLSDAIASTDYDTLVVNNSLLLLRDINLISYTDHGIKKANKDIGGLGGLLAYFKEKLPKTYGLFFDYLYAQQKTYDEKSGLFWISRNSVPLQYSGLLMLSDSSGIISCPDRNRIFLLNYSFNIETDSVLEPKAKTIITIDELQNSLVIKNVVGEEAEKIALNFEQNILLKNGIKKTPIQISHSDVTAGYDIASYLTKESAIPDKFIEVKSCKNDTFTFYLSRNELETAKAKQQSYFLYLYNRENHSFTVFQNPYRTVYSNENWLHESQIYKIRTVLDGNHISDSR